MLKTLQELRQKNPGKRISFVSGHFRIIHVGHIRLLRFAKEMSDILVVGVLPDDSFDPLNNHELDRLEAIRAVVSVDFSAIVYDVPSLLQQLRPNFVVKGKEHEYKENIEQKTLEEYGGRLLFTAGSIMPSVSDNTQMHDSNVLPLYFPREYFDRHHIHKSALLEVLETLKNLRVMVIGDVIVDEYITCDPLGMSQEDPTIVVSPVAYNSYLGGAGIVAAHAAGLGAQVRFLTVCGTDATADFIEKKLHDYSVTGHIFKDESRPTTLKQRYRCKGKTLLRVSHLRQHAIDHDISTSMLKTIKKSLKETDLLIFSDFNYGCLPQPFVDKIIKYAAAQGIQIIADSQSSSQVGDVSRFSNTTLLTPTEREARLAMHDFDSGLVVLAEKLSEKTNAPHVILTLGEAGVLIQSDSTDQIPALNPNPVDVAGAGDSLLVCAGLCLAAGSDIWHAACLGSLVAGIQISREGNIPLDKDAIMRQLKSWN